MPQESSGNDFLVPTALRVVFWLVPRSWLKETWKSFGSIPNYHKATSLVPHFSLYLGQHKQLYSASLFGENTPRLCFFCLVLYTGYALGLEAGRQPMQKPWCFGPAMQESVNNYPLLLLACMKTNSQGAKWTHQLNLLPRWKWEMKVRLPRCFFSKPLLAPSSALSRCLCSQEAWSEAVGDLAWLWTGKQTSHLACSAPLRQCRIPEMVYYAAQLRFTRMNIWWSLFVWTNVINSFGLQLSLARALWDRHLRELFPVKFCNGESLGNPARTDADSSFLYAAVFPEYFCLTLLWCSRLLLSVD